MSDSVRPHIRKPTRLPRPWDSPDKNTGVSCHFFLQCIKVKSESEVAQSCLTFSDPTDCRLPGSSVHGIFQARVLEWGAITFSDCLCYTNRKYCSSIIPQIIYSASPKNYFSSLTKTLCLYPKSIHSNSGVYSGSCRVWEESVHLLLFLLHASF